MNRELGFDRPLPDRIDIERLVLGAAMTDPEAFPQIADTLRAEDFSLEKHKQIFRCIAAVFNKGEAGGCMSVANELIKIGTLERVDGMSYLVALTDGMPVLVNLAAWCELIRTAAVKRGAIESAMNLIERCLDPGGEADSLLASAERVTEILNSQSCRQTTTRSLEQIIAAEGGLNEFLSPDRKPGIHVPFADIHDTLRGLRRSKFIIIGARPAVGKTALAMQLAEHAANGHRVLFVTLEMSGRDLFHRAITGRARVSAYRFGLGTLDGHDRGRLQAETAKLLELRDRLLIVDKSDTTVQGIGSLLRSASARGESIDLVIVDYLQLLASVGRFENRVQEVSQISRGLKKITQAFDIPLVALSQLTRKEEHRKNDRPELDWLKESGQLEQDSDQVMFLWVGRDPDEGETVREVKWRVAKNRDGVLNHGTLTFQTRYCRFDDGRNDRTNAA